MLLHSTKLDVPRCCFIQLSNKQCVAPTVDDAHLSQCTLESMALMSSAVHEPPQTLCVNLPAKKIVKEWYGIDLNMVQGPFAPRG